MEGPVKTLEAYHQLASQFLSHWTRLGAASAVYWTASYTSKDTAAEGERGSISVVLGSSSHLGGYTVRDRNNVHYPALRSSGRTPPPRLGIACHSQLRPRFALLLFSSPYQIQLSKYGPFSLIKRQQEKGITICGIAVQTLFRPYISPR